MAWCKSVLRQTGGRYEVVDICHTVEARGSLWLCKEEKPFCDALI